MKCLVLAGETAKALLVRRVHGAASCAHKPSSPLVALFTVSVAGCAAESRDASNAGASEEEWVAGTASRRLSTELFSDKDPKPSDPVDYVLLGNVPGSTEPCSVTIGRRGLSPARNSWSRVAIHPFGASQETVEEHGPVDIGWAMPPDASSSRESIKVTGDELVYKRLPHGQSEEDMTLTAHFAASKKHGYTTLTDAAISGTNIVGVQKASCENLRPLMIVKDSIIEPIVKKAFDKWMADNNDDTDMDFEGCSVSSPTTVSCDYGNQTNEEQLGLTFALTNGTIGKLLDAQRSSDF